MSRVEETDPDGVDYGWVMQTTFVLTVVVGAPLVGLVAAVQPLPTWTARAAFAVRVGAAVWLVTAVAAYLYARWTETATDTMAARAPDSADDGPDVDE